MTEQTLTMTRDAVHGLSLKPCPFCGSNDVEICTIDEDTDVVACNGCFAQGGNWEGESTGPEEAADLWNRRVEPAPEEAR